MAMTKSLKESFITLLSKLDISGMGIDDEANEAKAEIGKAIKMLENNKIVIDDTEDNKQLIAEFILDMFNQFPCLRNKHNQILLNKETFSPTITPRPNPSAHH